MREIEAFRTRFASTYLYKGAPPQLGSMLTPKSASPRIELSVVAAPYNRVQIRLGGTIESAQQWSTGFWVLSGADFSTSADLDAFLLAIKPAVAAWWNNPAGVAQINAVDTVLSSIRAYDYAALATKAGSQAEEPIGPLAGIEGGIVPTQTALVNSLLSGKPGKHFRGRMYLPATGVALTNHQLADSLTLGIAQSTAQLLTAVNGIALGPANAQVIIGGNSPAPARVTSVKVDSEPDIQRRRADKLAGVFVHTVAV